MLESLNDFANIMIIRFEAAKSAKATENHIILYIHNEKKALLEIIFKRTNKMVWHASENTLFSLFSMVYEYIDDYVAVVVVFFSRCCFRQKLSHKKIFAKNCDVIK